jgi:hypothetical protein
MIDLLSLRPLRIRLRIIEAWIALHINLKKRVRMVFTTASLNVLVLAKTLLEACAIQVVQFSPDKQFRVVTAR